MKKTLLTLIAFAFMTASAQAQCLTLKKKYGTNWQNEHVGTANKPAGYMYRLREEIQCTNLPRIPRVDDEDMPKRLIIAERVANGWMALYRNEMLAPTYDFVVVLYDTDKVASRCIDLCEVSQTYNCEVQDVRYDVQNGLLFFNMACPSYSSQLGGKGSKLFCYNVEKEELVWSTPYLTSNDIFIFNQKYVFCSYGFTNEKDYIFMVDKFTGKVYSKLPTSSSVQYVELQQHDGKELLYAVDYGDRLYVYDINDTNVAPASTQKSSGKRSSGKSGGKKSSKKK